MSVPKLGLLVLILGTASCASTNELELMLRVRQLEQANKTLQNELLQTEIEALYLRRGQALQAEMLEECWALI